MSGRNGSSALTDEQASWFERTYGARYLRVQTNASQASRKQRRASRKKQRAQR